MKMSNNPAIYEVPTKQYLRSILDISGNIGTANDLHFWRKGALASN